MEPDLDYDQFKEEKSSLGWDLSDIIKVSSCHGCCREEACRFSRTPNMQYYGSDNPDIMFVTASPSRSADHNGCLLDGYGKSFFSSALDEAGLGHTSLGYSSIIKCSSYDASNKSRDPYQTEIDNCISNLYNELDKYNPKVIVALGSVPLTCLVGKHAVSKVHGRVYNVNINGIPRVIIPTFSPSFISRSLKFSDSSDILLSFKNDMKVVKNVLNPHEVDYGIIKDFDELKNLVNNILIEYYSGTLYAGMIAIDLEWKGADGDPFNACKSACKIASINISHKPYFGRVILWDHIESNFRDNLTRSKIITLLQNMLNEVPVGNHNLKIDNNMMKHRLGLFIKKFAFCTMLSHQQLVAGSSEGSSLEYVAQKYEGMPSWKYLTDEALLVFPKEDRDFLHIPLDTLEKYGCIDVDAVIRIAPKLKKELENKDMYKSYMSITNASIEPVSDMESNGQHVDIDVYKDIENNYEIVLDKSRDALLGYPAIKNTIEKMDQKFNINAYSFLNELYFEQLRLPWLEKTKKSGQPKKLKKGQTGDPGIHPDTYKTDLTVRSFLLSYTGSGGTAGLELIPGDSPRHQDIDFEEAYEIVKLTHEFKSAYSLKTKYVVPLKNYISDDGAVHATYKICSTATGRSATVDPPVHTLPPRTNIRDMFVSRWVGDGGIILKCDESQAELRIMATLANDKALLTAFEEDRDIHRYVAHRILKKPENEITYDERRHAKTCFTGDTKISLLNGTEVPIKNLVDEEEFWVYSYDIEHNKIVPGRGHSARLTKKNAKLVKIILDNDEDIKCTPNHRFLMRDGTYKEAQDLLPGDSLMPLYKKHSDIKKDGLLGYEMCHAGTGKWEFTHRISAELSKDNKCSICCNNSEKKHSMRHHKDYNKLNNNPDNLEWLTWKEHYTIHSDNVRLLWDDSEFRKKFHDRTSLRVKKYWKNPEYRSKTLAFSSSVMTKLWKNPEFRLRNSNRVRQQILRLWKDPIFVEKMSIAHSKFMIQLNHKNWSNKDYRNKMVKRLYDNSQNPILRKKTSDRNRKNWKNPEYRKHMISIMKKNAHIQHHIKKDLVNLACEFCKEFADTQDTRISNMKYQINHKVKSVEWLNHTEDVYDFTVDKYHNFNIRAGVFVHNCSFAILYGGGPSLIAEQNGLSFEVSTKLMEDFFSEFSNVKKYLDLTWLEAKKNGFVKIPTGRIRHIPYTHSRDRKLVSQAKRRAYNTPIQGSATLIVLDGLNKIYHDLIKLGLKSKIISYTHDAVACDIYPGEMFQVARIMKYHLMDNLLNVHSWLKTKMKVDFDCGYNEGFMLHINKFNINNNEKGFFRLSGFEHRVHQFVEEISKIYDTSHDFSEGKEKGEITGDLIFHGLRKSKFNIN